MTSTTKESGRNNAVTTSDMEIVQQVWPTLTELLFVPHTDEEYQRLVSILDALIDVVGENEEHPLASYMEVVGVLVEKYEDEYVPEITTA
jgi:HTH-type transcriptional regulator/antitoxin HigA